MGRLQPVSDRLKIIIEQTRVDPHCHRWVRVTQHPAHREHSQEPLAQLTPPGLTHADIGI